MVGIIKANFISYGIKMLTNEMSTNTIDVGYINVNNGTAICNISSKHKVETKNPNNEKMSTKILYDTFGSFFIAKAAHAFTNPMLVVRRAKITIMQNKRLPNEPNTRNELNVKIPVPSLNPA